MWLFRHKYHVDGSLSRYKARLVTDGRNQQYGVDCNDTFSLIVKTATIRIVLSLALARNWHVHQLDVTNAVLNGDLTETVYMYQASGFVDSRFPHHHDTEVAYLLIYIDDIVLKASSTTLLQRIISFLHKEFDMTDSGALNYFLGISVTRDARGMILSQKKYAMELLEHAHMLNCGLQYLTFTRPDIFYAAQQICLHMHDPREPHLAALKRVFVIFVVTLSRSIAEAEYRGVANVVAEAAWIHNLLRELHNPLFTATLVNCDNLENRVHPQLYNLVGTHGETGSRIQHEGEYTGPVEDDERTYMEVDEVVPSNVKTTYESNYHSSLLEGTKGCHKNLKVKVTSELFKWKSKDTRGCQKNLESLRKNLRECKYMGDAMTNAHTYILLNCEEVRPFVRLFNDLTRQRRPNIDANGLDIYRDQHFAAWFQNYVFQELNDISQDLKDLAQGPIDSCHTYKGYFINGYKFHTQRHSEGRLSNKSGVCVRGSVYNEDERDYYGILDDVIEVEYQCKIHGKGNCVVVLFKCKDDLVHIDSKVKLFNGNPFVLASQTEQVYYGPYPRMSKELRDWWALIKSQDEVKMKLLTECI
uniref:Ribonuclease H-like domain-containing protein n=1 Tax=Tanacetum cinerariifolium TaxID=118510 RepID=A0A699IBG2_TANCI|nr:ribonuclease H-like domain-containing protein [Tanacetum cinerariifolium]